MALKTLKGKDQDTDIGNTAQVHVYLQGVIQVARGTSLWGPSCTGCYICSNNKISIMQILMQFF